MIIGYRCLLLAVTGLALVESFTTDAVPENCTDVRINNGPLITPCVNEIILQKGQNFTLTCKGSTYLQFRQQEVSEEVTSNFKIEYTNSTIIEDEYSFESTINLYNVDQYAIGYYACSDDSVDAGIVNNIVTEPDNDEHVSYIYVYVNGTDSLFAPMREFIVSRSNKILIECRPTTPDVEVNLLSKSQNKTPKYSPKIGYILKKCGSFAFQCQGLRDEKNVTKHIRISASKPPEPTVINNSIFFLKNETFSLNCTAKLHRNTITTLSWLYPEAVSKDNSSIIEETNSGNVTEGLLYSNITIYNATEKHQGNYTCVSKNTCDSSTGVAVKVYHAEPSLNITLNTRRGFISRQPTVSIFFTVESYPSATFEFYKDGKKLSLGTGKYKKNERLFRNSKQVKLVIDPVDVTDNANFTLVASNGRLTKNETFEQIIAAKPVILNFGKKICLKGMDTNVKCDVSGFPLPRISWVFSSNNINIPMNSTSVNQTSIYNETAYLIKRCEHSGNITCKASNTDGDVYKTQQILVYDIMDGFGINTTSNNKTLWVLENEVVTVKCLASIYEFISVNWTMNDPEFRTTVDYPNASEFSHVAELKINQITLNHTGNYECYGVKTDGSRVYDNIQINVIELQPPVISDADDVDEDVFRFKSEYLNCSAVGAPRPEIKWYKDGEPIIIKNDSNVNISYWNLNLTAVNSTLTIKEMQEHNEGIYECRAESPTQFQKKTFNLKLKGDTQPFKNKHYVIAIAVIIIILIIMIVYLTLKIKKEKRFRKELAAAGLLYFKEGITKSLNPDLGIDEQAELLPYNEKFEFPSDRLILGKQLGAGAFGVVYKAEARGIVNAEETTPVAVKMVKKTADNMYIKALASELKIMVHLGKHINIVNLLGACTKNVGKRELVVIVEYCKYGNIHNYMQRHREVFIDQLDTDNKEKLGMVNRAYTSSSCGSTGLHSDYFGSANTQDTDNTFLNTANTVRSARKNIPNNNQPVEEVKASEGYVQPEWRSNYESDYSYDGRSPRPLTSRDLLAWSFQIARGMEYLASRKVLHGDLAARNILLADDNIVKICDFGLAKSIYKNDEYHKKENSPLPVKWLAIECMTDRIFSTQSDVWSFGIVLWELFTLAKTPYPNIHPASLLQFLSEGHRLDKPSYADDKLYDVMKKCWETKPTLRPTFSQLQEILGTFLEENVRNHYVDLNSTYMDKNVKVEGQEDYLAMMCAPDYNNLVTPSPHHYVNTDKSFFPPTPVKVDDEGYLQMSPSNQGIFSPRVPNTEFDFDPRKFNPKVSEASSCGSELTPMLTLNNLPTRSGSESDHEGNPPYLNACPRIDEEADEVFAPTLNDTKNAKNIQQSAVTNPTYITFENIDEKPKDIINNYVNVPNGLVK